MAAIDVDMPLVRRKRLVARLMAQLQQQAAARGQGPLGGASRQAMGTPSAQRSQPAIAGGGVRPALRAFANLPPQALPNADLSGMPSGFTRRGFDEGGGGYEDYAGEIDYGDPMDYDAMDSPQPGTGRGRAPVPGVPGEPGPVVPLPFMDGPVEAPRNAGYDGPHATAENSAGSGVTKYGSAGPPAAPQAPVWQRMGFSSEQAYNDFYGLSPQAQSAAMANRVTRNRLLTPF